MTELTVKHCVPCEGGVKPLTEAKANELLRQTPGWELKKNAKTGKNPMYMRICFQKNTENQIL